MQSAPGPDANQQQGYSQPGYPQPGYPQPVYTQPGYPQPGFPPPGYPQPAGYPQPGFQQPITSPPMAAGYQPVQQGNAAEWMTAPYGIPNCPPGLEYLTQIDQLLVQQQVELLEAFTGFETNNKYVVKNSMGQKVYFAVEDTDCFTRNCCGPSRPFDIKIMDNAGNEVIHLNRPLRCSCCCCPCCLQTMEVSSPPGTVIGYVEQNWSICYPNFSVKNAAGDVVLRMEGPICTFAVCGDVEFQVYSADKKTNVGKISKQWTGFVKETFTDADNFGINFPADLDVNIKATLLGACFLIDFMFFEKAANRERDRPGMM